MFNSRRPSKHVLFIQHIARLVGGLQHGLPEPALRIDRLTGADQRDRQVYQAIVVKPHNHIRLAGHGGMDGIVAQSQAVHRVVCIRTAAADRVARIEILDVDLDAFLLEIGIDLVAQ